MKQIITLKDYLSTHYTEQTAKAYLREIQAYQAAMPQAAKATYQDITRYLGTLRQRYHNTRTLNRILASIKAYYSYLHYIGRRNDHPAKAIRLRDQPSRDIQLQDLFSEQELELLLNRKERYTALYYRNQVMIGLLIYQALLPRELAQLTLSNINLKEGTVYIPASRSTNARTLSLKPQQVMLLHVYIHDIRPRLLKGQHTATLLISHRGTSESVERLVSFFKREYKTIFPGRVVNMKTIRQSVITNLLKKGHDLSQVQAFAGHKYPSTTERYQQSSVEALKDQINKYHPFQ